MESALQETRNEALPSINELLDLLRVLVNHEYMKFNAEAAKNLSYLAVKLAELKNEIELNCVNITQKYMSWTGHVLGKSPSLPSQPMMTLPTAPMIGQPSPKQMIRSDQTPPKLPDYPSKHPHSIIVQPPKYDQCALASNSKESIGAIPIKQPSDAAKHKGYLCFCRENNKFYLGIVTGNKTNIIELAPVIMEESARKTAVYDPARGSANPDSYYHPTKDDPRSKDLRNVYFAINSRYVKIAGINTLANDVAAATDSEIYDLSSYAGGLMLNLLFAINQRKEVKLFSDFPIKDLKDEFPKLQSSANKSPIKKSTEE